MKCNLTKNIPNPHNFWKGLNKQTRVARGSVPVKGYDNMFLTSDQDVVRDKWKNNLSTFYAMKSCFHHMTINVHT